MVDILGNTEASRMILSKSNFIRVPSQIFEEGVFYTLTVGKLQAFDTLFSGHNIEISICMRNPSSFVLASFDKSHIHLYDILITRATAEAVQYHGLIDRTRATLPKAKITAWSYENTPLIWPKLLRCIMALTDEDSVKCSHDLIASALTPTGTQRSQNYLKANPRS